MLFQDAIAGAIEAAQGVAGEPAILRRGSETVQVTAMPGRTEYERDDGGGVVVKASVADWIILASQYVFGGQKVEPQEGDQIEVLRGSVTETYEAMPIGDELFRPTDQWRTAYRIHTKLVSES